MTDELFRTDAYLKSCTAVVVSSVDGAIQLNRTIFYPSGGGQPGDSGILRTQMGSELEIIDTLKDEEGNIIHVLAEDVKTFPDAGDEVTVELNWERRHKHMRMHTCMHILCSLVAGDVTGGQVGVDKSRLDFNIPESPDKEKLEKEINRVIAENHPVSHSWITDAELDASPELVRTMSVSPPRGSGRVRIINVDGVDLQPCGGTHVKETSEIGPIRIGKIENKGKQNRRINIHFA
ncbi:MAG: alanyl-tRNA editing protein [Rhodospirillaceae bacterium]|nr:alanyl-tRNA editing protein [Rhodospirillaceae bacterium]